MTLAKKAFQSLATVERDRLLFLSGIVAKVAEEALGLLSFQKTSSFMNELELVRGMNSSILVVLDPKGKGKTPDPNAANRSPGDSEANPPSSKETVYNGAITV